ncbi:MULTISPECIES: ABC transporter permease [Tepidanaerobacter]|jgi:oligopeptide transport system permease protein|uniref:Dipeptide transport system permease protein DppC n=2 Tax=Tepidanaerobacter TaxID=499228 RepID=F4LRJ2_TEPAE|nr:MULTISPECIES: ABC transporter permease [Tepidanaerobacter]AEE90255.1 ABC-type transporter, integral membrane subunit [Tepidanaerobacter acetatoxydans Re1]CCP24720.1 Dipeptide transport system permease protein DppC [Tepidanaerobacter acetatoxydans Re1]GAQ24832.1 oligopeptide transport system permease protein [Tepidanaerobacter syntrophicus]GLI18900.1 diguanylate cyclase [Tepidanaerobacter syntrophicus]GLI51243.1 diguanylate cyclase [Tepidanaerobacter syntrophicus]
MDSSDIITDEMFTVVGKDIENYNLITRPSLSYWQDAWIRLKKNKVAMLGLAIIIFYIIMAIIGPYMTSADYRMTNSAIADQLPSKEHWFGTDSLGRDLWARVWLGARVSLTIGFAVTLLNQFIGIIIGGISGYFGGKLDMIIMRIIDVLYGIPSLIVAILVILVRGESGIASLIIAMIITGWIGSARFVRGQVLQLKNQEFVLAAKVLGASSMRIILRHLIPNMMGLLITNITMAIPGAIFSEAFLSYIGIGIQPPDTSWGQLAREGAQVFMAYPWEIFLPSFFISTTMLSLNLLGDGLRNALDPKMRGTAKV